MKTIPMLPLLILTSIMPLASAQAGDPSAARARTVLWDLVKNDETWAKIHAAEVLLDFGDAGDVRQFFHDRMSEAENARYRLGVWRIMARTAPNTLDRERWIRKIEAIALNPAERSRFGAMESLGKLGYQPSGQTLHQMRQLVRDISDDNKDMVLWCLAHAGELGAVSELAGRLAATDAAVRLSAAYALRWLRPTDPAVLQQVAAAADREPGDSPALAYVVGTALTIKADATRIESWRRRLEELAPSASEASRYEAAQALLPYRSEADLPAQEAFLNDDGKDIRVAAAWAILHVKARSRR